MGQIQVKIGSKEGSNLDLNRKGGPASLRSRTCVKRKAAFGARFKGLSLYFLYIYIYLSKRASDTYHI